MSTIRKTRTTLSIRQREKIIQRLDNGDNLDKVATEYNIHPNSVRRIRRNSERLRQYSRLHKSTEKIIMKLPVHDTLETKLYAWFAERSSLGDSLTGQLIQEKALRINREMNGPQTFRASNGWLDRFKKRHGIRQDTAYSEKIDTDIEPATKVICDLANLIADQEITLENKFICDLANLIDEQEIKLENIYNMAVTGLVWKLLPKKTLAYSREKTVFSKKVKDRVTLGLCANATGSHKLPPLFIHKYAKPRALKHCKNNVPVVYMSQCNAWIDQQIFNCWYKNYFKPSVVKHQLENCINGKVLLLVGNLAGHKLAEIQDDNFEVMFLFSNTTSMDQFIIEKTKRCFRKFMVHKVLSYPGGVEDFYEDYDVKDCIDMVWDAWNDVTTANIQNSWRALLNEVPGVVDTEVKSHMSQDTTSLQATLASITDITSQEVDEWLKECSQLEQQVLKIDQDEDGTMLERTDMEMDQVFLRLAKWSERQPDVIKQQVQSLKNYYNNQEERH